MLYFFNCHILSMTSATPLAPWGLLPNAPGSTLELWFPSSATHFLWLLLCLEPSDWRTEKGKKKEWRLVHILPITAPLVKQNDSSPSLRTLAAAHHHSRHRSPLPTTTAATLLPMGERGWKEGKKKREPGDSPAPSLWQLGVSLFLGSETRNFTWRISLGALPICPWYTLLSFWLPLGPGCATQEEKKNGKLTAGLVELWILVSFPNLRATIYVSGPSESCSIRSVQNL